MKKKLLLNWLYYRPVGHVVEALKIAKGYSLANKNIDIYLIINSDSPIELPNACSWIKKTYAVSLKEIEKNGRQAKSLKKIPKKWDYVITDNRARNFIKDIDDNDLIKAQKILSDSLVARINKGYVEQGGSHESGILPINSNPKIKLIIPKKAETFAKKFKHKGAKICIMLGGSAGEKQSPSIKMWLKICLALDNAIPNLKIYFTGISKSDNGRTITKGFTLKDVKYLISKLHNAESVYDVGLWNQIAFIKKCDIFLSPHTGFAFIPPLVGTPWLEIGTCRWPAYLFNDLAFYSVLPKCGSYPSLNEMKKGCGKLLQENKKANCVNDKAVEREIPDIIKGARLLLNKDYTYDQAMKLHLRKINKDYDIDKFFFFGGVPNI